MRKISIGMVLNQLIDEKNLSVSQVAESIGKSRQNVYADLKRTSMHDDMISSYAKTLGIEKDVIYSRMEGVEESKGESQEDSYLQQHLIKLEAQFKALAEQLQQQLAIKDKQIEGYQRTVDVLLGKSEDVMQLVATRVIPMYALEAERA